MKTAKLTISKKLLEAAPPNFFGVEVTLALLVGPLDNAMFYSWLVGLGRIRRAVVPLPAGLYDAARRLLKQVTDAKQIDWLGMVTSVQYGLMAGVVTPFGKGKLHFRPKPNPDIIVMIASGTDEIASIAWALRYIAEFGHKSVRRKALALAKKLATLNELLNGQLEKAQLAVKLGQAMANLSTNQKQKLRDQLYPVDYRLAHLARSS